MEFLPGRDPMNSGPKKWRALVVDPEAATRRTVQTLLSQYPNVDVDNQCASTEEAVEEMRTFEPDVVLIDVKLPGASSIETAWSAVSPIVVFTTNDAEHALMSSLDHPSDFLLKPVSAERLTTLMTRVLWCLEHAYEVFLTRSPRALHVREPGGTIVVLISEIDWIQTEEYCTRVYAGRRKPLILRSLAVLLDDLQADGFMRVNRTTIVNLTRIREVRSVPSGDAEAFLTIGRILPVTRSHRTLLENRLHMRKR